MINSIDTSVNSVYKENQPLPLWKVPSLFPLSSNTSLLPYKIVKYMAAHALIPFVKSAVQHIGDKCIDIEEARTGCVVNVYALSIIFSGQNKAKFLMDRIGYLCKQSSSLALADKTRWEYYVENLFGGEIIAIANTELPDQSISNEFVNQIKHIYTKKFFDYTNPIFDACLEIQPTSSSSEANEKVINNFEKALTNFKYDFNESVISSLKIQMDLNQGKVNEQASYIYYIGILRYESGGDANSWKNVGYYHMFAIEQFNSPKGVLYRVYNSWKDALTLLDFFQKRGYGEEDEGCLTYAQIKAFLEDVHRIVAPTTDPNALNNLQERCFGYTYRAEPPLLYFDAKKRSLQGRSLRYVSCEFNPRDCLENFNHLINSLNQ